MKADLSRLLRPRSVAVLGGGWARNVVEQCLKADYSGTIWPVHPTADEMCGIQCYPSLSDLPGAPDAAFIGINRELTLSAVSELRELDCGGAICFASGFSEAAAEDADGVELQAELLLAAGNMPIIGPNCYGLINYLDGAALWPDQHGGQRVERGVALLTQSSNIAINLTMQRRALPIAYVLTAGNQAQLSLGELGQALLRDERVTALGLYIESIGNVRAFEEMAALARELGKPVIAIKAGRSRAAQKAMISHTNSLAGNDAASDAFLKRVGVTRVYSLSLMLETLKILHLFGPLPGRKVQSMSCSGGEAALVSDSAVGVGVSFPELEEAQEQAMRDALGPLVALANPLDYHTYIWDNLPAMQAAFYAMMLGEADITALVLDFPRSDRCDANSWQTAITALSDASCKARRHAAIIASLPENLDESDALDLMARDIVPLCGLDDALAAIAAAADAYNALNLKPLPTLLPFTNGAAVSGSVSAPGSVITSALSSEYSGELLVDMGQSPGQDRGQHRDPDQGMGQGKSKSQGHSQGHNNRSDKQAALPSKTSLTQLTEAEAKGLLVAAGVVAPVSMVINTPDQGKASEDFADLLMGSAEFPKLSFPVVLKALGIAHKSDLQAVQLEIQSAEELRKAALEMNQRLQQHGLEPNGFLIEQQITAVIVELLVSVVADDVHGLMLTIAAGGVQTELAKDATQLLLPFSATELSGALESLAISTLLHGYRGKPAVAMQPVLDSIMVIQDFSIKHAAQLRELEINPLLCTADAAIMADAILVFTGDPDES